MSAVLQPWQILVAALAGWITRQQDAVIEYRRIEELTVRMARENPRWGYGKLEGERLKLGFKVSRTTIRNVLDRHQIIDRLNIKRDACGIGEVHTITHDVREAVDTSKTNAGCIRQCAITVIQHRAIERLGETGNGQYIIVGILVIGEQG